MPINIPSDHLTALSALSALPIEKFDSMIKGAESFKSGLLLKAIPKQIQELLENLNWENLNIESADLLSRVLLNLHISYRRSGTSLESFVDDIVCQVDKQNRELLRDQLKKVLQIRPIALSVKASSIQVSHDRVYNSCFIATDIRPIFEDPINDGLAGSLIVHQMRITSIRNRKQEDLFFALDDDDLTSLSTSILRALEKSGQLRIKLSALNIAQLDNEKE